MAPAVAAIATAAAGGASRLPMMPARLSVEDAAHTLGLSQDTIKRRLKRGSLRGERERTPSGFRWYVLLGEPATATATANGVVPATAGTANAMADATADQEADATQEPPAFPTMALETMRATGMAQYTRELLEPLYARLEAQAEVIGGLRNELEHVRAQLVEATSTNGQTETQNAAAPEWPERRRWWQRLMWG